MTSTDMLNRLKAGKATATTAAYVEVEPQLIFDANPNREGFIITNMNDGADLELIYVSEPDDGDSYPPVLPNVPTVIIPPMSAYESGLMTFTGRIYGAYTEASGANSKGFNATELSK